MRHNLAYFGVMERVSHSLIFTCICIYINLDIVAGTGKTILTYGYYELKIVKSITC